MRNETTKELVHEIADGWLQVQIYFWKLGTMTQYFTEVTNHASSLNELDAIRLRGGELERCSKLLEEAKAWIQNDRIKRTQ